MTLWTDHLLDFLLIRCPYRRKPLTERAHEDAHLVAREDERVVEEVKLLPEFGRLVLEVIHRVSDATTTHLGVCDLRFIAELSDYWQIATMRIACMLRTHDSAHAGSSQMRSLAVSRWRECIGEVVP